MKPSILVVDDEQSMRDMLSIFLQREGYRVTCATDGHDALACCEQQEFDVVISDIKMPGMDGISLLHELRRRNPETLVIMITAFGTFESARESMQKDAWDYLTKPFDVEQVKAKIEAGLRQRQSPANAQPEAGGEMIGASRAMQRVRELTALAATSDSTVLITGESGTGKELVARAIHRHSRRAAAGFVAINCGGIPETLLESELFGYRKGAFTGAVQDKKGYLDAAEGGSLFLDEVGDLPLPLQVKLLRVLQERCFVPVGATAERACDVRVIAATNCALEERIQQGEFREDLYYRLNVIPIVVPPLRERHEDIPLLAEHFLQAFARTMGKEVSALSSFVLDCLVHYDFPGNVRELENIIERGVALSTSRIMLPESLELSRLSADPVVSDSPAPAAGGRLPAAGMDLDAALADIERDYIEQALQAADGSLTAAARLLGVTFRSLRYRVSKLGLADKSGRGP